MTRSFADALTLNLIQGGEFVVTAQCAPLCGTSANSLKTCADVLAGVVNAVHVPECEDGIRMSALAACGHLISAGAEPILHLLTRDMNRIALQATLLGAASMGVKSVLCTTGRHQTLTDSRSARGVFDIDPIQLLAIADAMRKDGMLADGRKIEGEFNVLIGTDTNPFSDPIELQVIAMEKAVAAGADFVVTQPVFKLERFDEWMGLVRERKLHERTCIIASVMPLSSAQQAAELARKYSHLDIGDDVISRLASSSGAQIASETAASLKAIEGVRGICVMCDDCALAKEVISSSGIAGS